jgi:hypothetical protein
MVNCHALSAVRAVVVCVLRVAPPESMKLTLTTERLGFARFVPLTWT